MKTKKIILVILFVILIFIIGCTQEKAASEATDELGKQAINGCDGVCDNFEEQHTESPCYKSDCLGIEEGSNLIKQEQKSGQEPPPECLGKQATDADLPQSCKIWFSIEHIEQQGQQPLEPPQPKQQESKQQEDTITVEATGSAYKSTTGRTILLKGGIGKYFYRRS